MDTERTHRLTRRLAVGLLVVVALGCESGAAGDGGTASPHAAALDALGRRAWAALVQADTAALERLRLTEHEHNEIIWPELPASQANFPMDFAWRNIQMRNRAALERLLGEFSGSDLRVDTVECIGAPEHFDGFQVLRDCYVRLEDSAAPRGAVQLFKDVAVLDGKLEIFRYYAD